MTLITILLGLILLAFGRRLFWLLVGTLGFIAGMTIASRFFPEHPDSHLVVAFALGGVCALLAVFLQKFAIGVAGFVGGGYLALMLAERFGWAAGQAPWVPFVIGGIVGALIAGLLFKWALIVLSSIAGAFFVVRPFDLGVDTMLLVIALVAIAGIAFQAGSLSRKPAPRKKEP